MKRVKKNSKAQMRNNELYKILKHSVPAYTGGGKRLESQEINQDTYQKRT